MQRRRPIRGINFGTLWLRALVLCMGLAPLCSQAQTGHPQALHSQTGHSQTGHPTGSQVKAAYLFNFGKFVRWPVNPLAGGDAFEICVLGKNPFGAVLQATVEGESIDGKTIIARNLPSIEDAGHCRILFISSSEEGRLSSILSVIRHLHTLTVSDIPAFSQRGGMIEFVSQQDRIRFAVNMAPMSEAGLTVSSELLKVATKVINVPEVKD